MCEEPVKVFEQCHKDDSFAMFLGTCNKLRQAMDSCLSQEFLVRREVNKYRREIDAQK